MPGFHERLFLCNLYATVRENLLSVLINQGQLMNEEQCLQANEEKLMQLADVLSQASVSRFTQIYSDTTSSLIALPDKFTGEAALCWGFLL